MADARTSALEKSAKEIASLNIIIAFDRQPFIAKELRRSDGRVYREEKVVVSA